MPKLKVHDNISTSKNENESINKDNNNSLILDNCIDTIDEPIKCKKIKNSKLSKNKTIIAKTTETKKINKTEETEETEEVKETDKNLVVINSKDSEKAPKRKNRRQIKITVDETDTFEITLPTNIFNIEFNKENYNVYACNSKSFIIVDKNNLRIVCKKFFLEIKRENDIYQFYTNQSIKLDPTVKINNFYKNKDNISFNVKKICKVFLENGYINIENNANNDKFENISDNNKLIISENDKKIFLPYKANDIEKEYENNKNKYNSILEVIEKKYTLPINSFKHAISARYKEAYNLMRHKEKKSIKASILLGLELMFEFNLHPAIIKACKNLEELDIYLDCLDDNELEKFSCFKIIYKSMPTIVSKKKLQSNSI